MTGKNEKIIKYLPFLILLAIAVAFFWKAALLKGIFFTGDIDGSDIMHFNFPSRDFLSMSLKSGSFPLWTKDIYNGFPIFAEGQGGFMYLPNLILFGLLPSAAAYNYSVILTFILTGFFMFLYARSIGMKRTGAFTAGLVLMLGGFFVTHLKQMNMINTAMWVPLMLFFAEKYFKSRSSLYILFSGIVFGMQVFAGNPQIAYYTVLLLTIYYMFRFFIENKQKKIPKALAGTAGVIAVIVVIGMGLAAVQVLPGNELKKLSMRQNMSYDEAVTWAYEPQDMILFISPYHYGDPAKRTYQRGNTIFWENCIYVGLLTLMLAFFAVVTGIKKNRFTGFHLFSAVLFLLLVMPKTTPLFKLFWDIVPGFNLFRFPHRLLLFVELSIAVLAGFGLDSLTEKLNGTFKKGRQDFSYLAGYCMAAVIAVDLFLFGAGHNRVIEQEKLFSKPSTAEFVLKTNEKFRVISLGKGPAWRWADALAKGWKGDLSQFVRHRELVPENLNMVYGIESFSGYSSFFIQRFSDLLASMNQYITTGDYPGWQAALPYKITRYLGLGNVKYIITIYDIKDKNLKPVMNTFLNEKIPEIRVYENKLFMKRAFVVPKAVCIPDRYTNSSTLFNTEFDITKTITIEEPVSGGSDSVDGSVVNIDEYTDKEVKISVEMTGDGFLVLTDTYYPGWKVFVDGKKGHILQADYLFRAVKLDRGKHEVNFQYKPETFRNGIFVSGLMLIFVMITIVHSQKIKRGIK